MVFSTFEADHKIAYMVNNGFVDGVISTDGDYLALMNCPVVVLPLSWNKMEASICLGDNHAFGGHNKLKSITTYGQVSGKQITTCDYAI